MLVDFALEFDQFEMYAFGQKGEFSRVREIFWERGVLEGTQIDRLVGSCKLESDMLANGGEGEGEGVKNSSKFYTASARCLLLTLLFLLLLLKRRGEKCRD